MPRYSEERKAAVLKKLLPPQNRSVVSVAAEEGISDVTLYSWLKQCRQQGMNRHQFARHLSAIQNGNQRGIYEQQALSRRIQD